MTDHEYECHPIGSGAYQITIRFEFPKRVDGRMSMAVSGCFYGSARDFEAVLDFIRQLESKCMAVQ